MKNFDESMLGVVVLNYNTFEATLNVVEELKKQVCSFPVEILIVDNNSTNESKTVIEERQGQGGYSCIFLKENGGYAKGNNIGLSYFSKKKAKYALVVNNDIEFDDLFALQKLYDCLESNPKVGCVSPKIVSPSGKEDKPLYPKKPSFFDLTLGIICYYKNRNKINDDSTFEIYAPRGSCMMLKMEALEHVNYLDENTFLYYEEPILAERMSKAGYKTIHNGAVKIIHNHGKTIKSTFEKKRIIKIMIESYKYYLKEYRGFNSLMIALCVFCRKAILSVRL
ncbi:MAG: glycosyltransferase family 2 protein [Bacilli bacterium]|nr:glycosyltransferase family 2 protein [Bacilli bacterium]